MRRVVRIVHMCMFLTVRHDTQSRLIADFFSFCPPLMVAGCLGGAAGWLIITSPPAQTPAPYHLHQAPAWRPRLRSHFLPGNKQCCCSGFKFICKLLSSLRSQLDSTSCLRTFLKTPPFQVQAVLASTCHSCFTTPARPRQQ